jgi:chromosomal replication initiation ATPase DnaA
VTAGTAISASAGDARHRFDTFIVGSGSRLAVAASRAVAESPGSAYNPLFIYSGSGLGKTHLMGAIATHARAIQPALAIDYLTLDEFVQQMHAAISLGESEAFRHRYQRVDLLLLDDVQFLTGRRETQSEMLRLFNVLQGAGRQIVMASDRPPSEIADVDERLLTRLAGGLVVDIGAPEYETRVAILRQRCDERGVRFAAGVIEALARIPFGNVRELQGGLNRLIAYQALEGGEIGATDVGAMLGRTPDVAAADPVRLTSTAMSSGSVAGAAASIAAGRETGEFELFVTGLTHTVAQHVEAWRARLGEAIAYWSGEGYRVAALEAIVAAGEPVDDVEAVLDRFAVAVDRLRALEAEVTAIDAALGGDEIFRDPEAVSDAERFVARARDGLLPPAGPSLSFTREGYESGASNQLAVRAADAVVADPGRTYNPLFVHGPSGTGKTHLLHAIGHELAAATGGATTAAVIGAQQFVDGLIAAIQDGTVDRWRARFRAAGALLLDDVHFLAGKEQTQEELFHVFNALQAEGKQIVLTSDRPPSELGELEARLRSRFEGGLVVAVHPPDRALREKLYARYLAQAGTEADAGLLAFLADRSVASVREIAGMVHRLVTAADVAGVAVTQALAEHELDGPGVGRQPAPVAVRVVDDFFLDDEKVVWDWPDVGGRVIEEWR